MKRIGCKAAASAIVPLLLIALVFALLAGCDTGPVYQEPVAGTVCRVDFPSSADGFGIPSSVYLPRGYNPAKAYPVWLELHALYGNPLLDNDPANVFSNELKRIADEKGWIMLAPWGRNLHSMFVDGISREGRDYPEPEIYDDFSAGAASWKAQGGKWSWSEANGSYVQSDPSRSWKESVHEGSLGKEYSVRVKVREGGKVADSGFGVNMRRNGAGDCYHVDLYRGANNQTYVRFFKLEGGKWQAMSTMAFEWAPLTADGWIDLKVSCYVDYLEVYVNEKTVNMQTEYNATPYGYGMDVPGQPLPPGKVSLASYGGAHEFDEVRIQNEYPYGERDVLDSLLGLMEKYRIDPARIYVAGHSQGGLGAFVFGLHHPDLCAALRPADGLTDLYYDYTWFVDYYPPEPGPPYADVNDGRLADYVRALAGGEPEGREERMSVLNGSSARYILENGVNNHWRVVHGTPDANIPNSLEPVQICWWAPWFFIWTQSPAPARYNPATSEYENGKYVADKLQEWSRRPRGGYSCVYLTSPNIGHGFLEPYGDTANYFRDKALVRRPAEVAYKTYDEVNTGAWWLRLEIPNPGRNEPGMARVMADAAANSAAIHARNLSRLRLDLPWMGLDAGAGRILTFTLDDDTSPNEPEIEDKTGALDLELLGPWTAASYEIKLDGMPVACSIDGASLLLPGLPLRGGHTLTIAVPGSLPANLAPNPGAEAAAGGAPAGWTKVAQGGAFTLAWEELEAHGGARSLRVKGSGPCRRGERALWRSTSFAVEAGREYLLTAFGKARMLAGARQVIGITWYDEGGQEIATDWEQDAGAGGFALSREWSPLGLTAGAPERARYASIAVGVEAREAGPCGGSAFFDDVSFTCMGTGSDS